MEIEYCKHGMIVGTCNLCEPVVINGYSWWGEQQYRFLGFLAKTATFFAQVRSENEIAFKEKYYGVKGCYPAKEFYLYDLGANKWWNSLGLSFPLTDNMDLGTNVNITPTENNQGVIYNNDLWWYLLDMGFDLGAVHDTNMIESNVPAKFIEYFKEGLCLKN